MFCRSNAPMEPVYQTASLPLDIPRSGHYLARKQLETDVLILCLITSFGAATERITRWSGWHRPEDKKTVLDKLGD